MYGKKLIIALLIISCLAVTGAIFTYEKGGSALAFLENNLQLFATYQNMANPYIKYVRIPEGLRKEEVADIYTRVLAWNDQDVHEFLNGTSTTNLEGYYFPSTYILPANANGEEVKDEMLDTFNKNVTDNKQLDVINKNKVNLDTILKIASLIQREAASKKDMNLISGIIWNRIWKGMSLDIDATLQYSKGTDTTGWWPVVKSQDKNIDSAYNTYKNKGLPPTPISNPGLDAIKAAYNPAKTNCLFYFHDNNRVIHCSETYLEHMNGVDQYLK